jgi:integrase
MPVRILASDAMPKIIEKALTPLTVRSLNEPGRYADGNGLYLVVDPSGAKHWILRTLVHGKRRDMGLGGLQLVPLAEARKRAAKYRLIARDGDDPILQRREERRTVPTFKEAAETVHAHRIGGWKNEKHRAQWLSTLTTYAFPEIGGKQVSRIDSADVLRVLSPIWTSKPETARRVKPRIGTVLDWAKAAGHRRGDNPVDAAVEGLPKQTDTVEHHDALPYPEVPDFIAKLRATGATDATKLAFEFLILTAARTGEVIGARWPEINLESEIWTIPKDRMKAKREHRVPLSPRCIEILKAARKLSEGNGYIFPSGDPDTPLSNMAFLMTLRRMGHNVTAHGFRSAFRVWAAERTAFPREVSEFALAHVNANQVEAAYLRSDLFEQRRALMAQWATHATIPAKRGKVLRMEKGTTKSA